MPQGINRRWFQSIAVLGLAFLVIEGFWYAWSYSKSWCIPNYQLSVSFKNLSFFVAWSSKNSKKKSFQVRDFMASCLNRQDQKIYLIFKSVPLSMPRLFIQMVPKWRECLLKWVHYEQWSPILLRSKIKPLKNLSFFFCTDFLIKEFIHLSRGIDKIKMTKIFKSTSSFISCTWWHQSSVYISQKALSRMQTLIIKK